MIEWKSEWRWYDVESTISVGPRWHGRWVAICRMEDGRLRGARCGSKQAARAIARRYNGVVRRFRSRNWKRPEPAKAKAMALVTTWSMKRPAPQAPSEDV
jgi:hypothetical protein